MLIEIQIVCSRSIDKSSLSGEPLVYVFQSTFDIHQDLMQHYECLQDCIWSIVIDAAALSIKSRHLFMTFYVLYFAGNIYQVLERVLIWLTFWFWR